MSIVLGIDIGVSPSPCGLAAYDVDAGTFWTRLVRPEDARASVDERIASIARQIDEVVNRRFSPAMISALAYEAAHLQANPQTGLKLSRMCGAVVAIAALRGLPCYAVSPVEAKLALTGSYQATKENMIDSAKMQFDLDVSSHEADAIGVALHVALTLRMQALVEASEARERKAVGA